MAKAVEIFADRGFHGTGMREIATAMGMSRPGVYHYFPTKERLLGDLIESITGTINEFLLGVAAEKMRPATERLENAMDGMIERVAARPAQMRLLAAREQSLPGELVAAHIESRRQALECVERMLTEGVKAGELRPCEPRVTAHAVFGMTNWIAWWFRPEDDDPTAIAKQLRQIFFRGLRCEDDGKPGIGDAVARLHEDLDTIERLIDSDQN